MFQKKMFFLPDCSTVTRSVPRLVAGAPRLVVGAPGLIRGAPEGHCVSPVNSGIWPPSDSGPTILKHSHMLRLTKSNFAEVMITI
jgi:hypothetical protein